MVETELLSFIFSNSFVFSALFGALGGLVHALDVGREVDVSQIFKRMLVSASVGIFAFFITYELLEITPAKRIAMSFMVGYLGSGVIRRFYNRF